MATLEQIREKLKKLDNKNDNNNSNDNTLYRHWDIPDNSDCTLRFLPDGDEDNTFFWAEKQMIRLSFPGIKGGDENKEITIQVPCVEMWGDTCPVHAEIRPWFNDASLEELARKYWKKRSYIFQGFVQNDGIPEKDAPENPVRRFIVGPQIFKIIKQALLDPDMEYIPTDYVNGTDFQIYKTKDGKYSNYTTSKWARRESALTDEQIAAIDEYGINDLSEFLPKRPSEEAVGVIHDMFTASVNGDLYDPSKWAKFYKPFGYDAPETSTTTTTTSTENHDTVEQTEKSQEETTIVTSGDDSNPKSASDILDMLKNRK